VKILAGFCLIFLLAACSKAPIPTSTSEEPIDLISDPVQVTPATDPSPIRKELSKGVVYIVPLADYSISGIAVSTQRYYSDWGSNVSPIDIAIIWGELVISENRAYISYSQSNRWVYFEWKAGCPVDQSYIEAHVSNTHAIPANDTVRAALLSIKKNEMVVLTGKLVSVSGNWKNEPVLWESSLVRTDAGDGACEVMYVTRVRIYNNIFE